MSQTINILNELLKLDPAAISKLLHQWVNTNDLISDHPDITVTTDNELGLLGVLRFVTGEKIAVECDGDNVIRFINMDVTESKDSV